MLLWSIDQPTKWHHVDLDFITLYMIYYTINIGWVDTEVALIYILPSTHDKLYQHRVDVCNHQVTIHRSGLHYSYMIGHTNIWLVDVDLTEPIMRHSLHLFSWLLIYSKPLRTVSKCNISICHDIRMRGIVMTEGLGVICWRSLLLYTFFTYNVQTLVCFL